MIYGGEKHQYNMNNMNTPVSPQPHPIPAHHSHIATVQSTSPPSSSTLPSYFLLNQKLMGCVSSCYHFYFSLSVSVAAASGLLVCAFL